MKKKIKGDIQMNKDLEALDRLFNSNLNNYEYRKEYDLIETELKEKENQDEILRIIKKTFSLRNALLQVCEKEHKVFPNRFKKIKEWLLR